MENPFKPAEKDMRIVLITAVSSLLAIAVIALLDHKFEDPYLVASFGATAVLIYGAPKAPFSQPKNVFFGHLFSAIIGVSIAMAFDALDLFGDYWWFAAGLAVCLAITAMVLTGTVHPPGGATALTCVVSGFFGPIYIVRPIMLGVVLMMAIAYAANILKARCEDKNCEQYEN